MHSHVNRASTWCFHKIGSLKFILVMNFVQSSLPNKLFLCAQFKKTEEDFEKMVEGKEVSGSDG